MKALLLTTAAIFLGLSTLPGQVTLRNSLTGKEKALKAEGHIGLGLPIEGPELAFGYRLLKGQLKDTNRGLIRVLPVDEEKTLRFSNGLSRKEDIEYTDIRNVPPISLPITDISHITYRKKGAKDWSNMGALITTLGALSALVVAPLASIDYSEGKMNSDLYFRWAGYSLGLTGVGVAMIIGGKKRHFDIQRPGQAAGKGLWVIEK
ncbi:MAG: hypothetical protein J5I94_19225 [Phaeodactylibacter sp.]|nr:hypothetical protein [Phaeodactylibacter sp.]